MFLKRSSVGWVRGDTVTRGMLYSRGKEQTRQRGSYKLNSRQKAEHENIHNTLFI